MVMRRWLGRILVVALGVGGFFAGLFFLGRWALEGLRDQERYLVAWSDIDCPAPAGLEVKEFLDQVRYYSQRQAFTQMPERFSILEDGLADKLSQAFAQHPWVEKVDGVTVAPSRQVNVRLSFRRPVLAVRVGKELRAVDRHGVLLPKNAATAVLPVYDGRPQPPQGGEGSPWGDPKVEQRARALADNPR